MVLTLLVAAGVFPNSYPIILLSDSLSDALCGLLDTVLVEDQAFRRAFIGQLKFQSRFDAFAGPMRFGIRRKLQGGLVGRANRELTIVVLDVKNEVALF